MKNNKGFSLVELIVVIAIMAILASVAVIGVSVYVPKAQKAADQQAINDVMDALTLHYYSNPETVTKAYVILGPNGVVLNNNPEDEVAYNAGLAAMEATFGADWQTAIKLQCEEWQGVNSTLSYKDSSYYGNESDLIDTVDSLTTALGDVVDNVGPGIIGEKFNETLTEYGVDKSNGKEVGNAAVLYVAENTKGKEDAIEAAFNSGFSAPGASTPADIANNIYNALYATGIGDAAAVAAIYAYAQGYAQYSGQADVFKPDFSDVDGDDAAIDALTAISNSLNSLGTINDMAGYAAAGGQGGKDLQAYIDMMGTVYDNRDIVSGNLSADDCYTDGTVENMLKGHAAMSKMSVATKPGEVAIVLTLDENGVPTVHVAPLNWDK